MFLNIQIMDDYLESPIRSLPRRRVLFQDNSPDNLDNLDVSINNLTNSPRKSIVTNESCSPPYRKVQALRLFDTPSTPKTIIQKSAFDQPKMAAREIFHRNLGHDYSVRPVAYRLYNKSLDDIDNTANVNPFTPDSGFNEKSKKRSRIALHESSTIVANSAPNVRRRSV
ncbi:Wee1-like protein kinase, partial [Pseudolycoriella hygida]